MSDRPVQPRLYPDVAAIVRKVALENGRTVPQEVNRSLRQHYKKKPSTAQKK